MSQLINTINNNKIIQTKNAVGICTGIYYTLTAAMGAKAAPGLMVIVDGISSYNSLCDKTAMRNQKEFKKINTGNKNSAELSYTFTQAKGNTATINNSSQSTPSRIIKRQCNK